MFKVGDCQNSPEILNNNVACSVAESKRPKAVHKVLQGVWKFRQSGSAFIHLHLTMSFLFFQISLKKQKSWE